MTSGVPILRGGFMTNHDFITPPLVISALTAPTWLHYLNDVWAVLLPVGGMILLVLQIVYYWKHIKK